jgi:membrane protein DedA with SNARE-associated domain
MDVAMLVHSAWLLPVLALLVAVDGPFPVVPSEPLLMTASAVAIGAQDVPMALGLFAAAFAGSVAGDHLLFALGRTSRSLARPGSGGIAGWVRRNIVRRPAVTIVGARFVPAGRLVSTTAAGRYGLSPARFLPCSIVSSALWACYIMGVGLLLGPLTGGDPVRGLVAGIAMGAVTAGAFALAERLRARRPVASAEEREGLDSRSPGEPANDSRRYAPAALTSAATATGSRAQGPARSRTRPSITGGAY